MLAFFHASINWFSCSVSIGGFHFLVKGPRFASAFRMGRLRKRRRRIKATGEDCGRKCESAESSARGWLSEERWRTTTPKAIAAASAPGVLVGLDKPGWSAGAP